MSNFIGPALPPHLLQTDSNDEDCNTLDDRKSNLYCNKGKLDSGTNLPPHILRAASEDAISSDWERDPPQLLRKQITQSEMSEDSADDTIGPIPPALCKNTKIPVEETYNVLPHNLHKNSQGETNIKMSHKRSSKSSDITDYDSTMIGPVMPTHLKELCHKEVSQDRTVNVIGPKLPKFFQSRHELEENKEHLIIGPSIPQHIAERPDELPTFVEVPCDPVKKPIMGPCLPSHLKLNANLSTDNKEDYSNMYGPALPPGFHPKTVVIDPKQRTQNEDSSDTDDGEMGPLPEGTSFNSKVQQQLEMRANLLRHSMTSDKSEASEGPVRESWMLELPADRAPVLGLKSRQFRRREAPDAGDRSVWTDTPADREKKKMAPKNKSPDRKSMERHAVEKRDEFMQKLAEQHSTKRERQSLLEIHEEKLEAKRKKNKEAGEVPERRPFSREVDLQVNRFDEAQKRSILKKAQHLNDRFSAGQSKFL